MSVVQSEFRAALLDAGHPVPDGLLNASGDPAGTRFDVYRNNLAVSLTEALATGFPLIKKLIGAENFDGLAGMYVRARPPKSPLMMHYGTDFPGYLESLSQLSHIGYLPDCARLDLALRRSYHAADASPLPADTLAVAPDVLCDMQVNLAPATIVLRSSWPIYDIWRFNMEQGAPKPKASAQDLLVTRIGFDPKPHLLPPGAATWFDALQKGETFGTALDVATRSTPAFDLTQTLTLALTIDALSAPRTA